MDWPWEDEEEDNTSGGATNETFPKTKTLSNAINNEMAK